MNWPELEQYTIFVRVDTTKASNNVTVDLGVLPPVLAFEAIRQVFETMSEHLEEERALLFFKNQLVEPVLAAEDDD